MTKLCLPKLLLTLSASLLVACNSGPSRNVSGNPTAQPSALPSPTPSTSMDPGSSPSPSNSPSVSASPEATATATPGSAPPPAGLAGDVPAGCNQDMNQRLTDGVGYCYEAQFNSFDDTVIDMTVYVPQPEKRQQLAGESKNHTPLIIHSHGFGGVKASDFAPAGTELDRQVALDLWQAGYWVISYTQRGFGGSGNQIGLMAPDKEGWDFVRLVDWAACHLRENAPLENATAEENADPEYDDCGSSWGASLLSNDAGTALIDFDDDVAVGTVGYSYGGAFQFNAQSTDPRVDAILPLGTWHDLRFSLHPNDTPKTAWITIMTAFSSPVPGVGGGNGEPLPDIIISANLEVEGGNQSTDDAPYNKARQVSVANANILAPNGPIAYCDDHATDYANKYSDQDGDPVNLEAASRPLHASTSRTARADLFMIQGYADTLFSLNEGLDNARCFEDAGRDTYYLAETSGHPLPAVGPAHYAGVDTSMYLDEIVHCGVDAQGEPQRYNSRDLGRQWFDAKLRQVGDFSEVLPQKVCITQQNADSALVLDVADPYFANGTSNSSDTAYKWSREGASFSSVAEIPIGGPIYTLPATTLITGEGSLGQGINMDPRVQFVALTTMATASVMAGIPSANLSIQRSNPASDEIFYIGTAVKRCQSRPTPDQDPQSCEDLAPELLHFQVMPIRVFATDAVGDADSSYPLDDPRNFDGEAKGHFYPIRFGDNPQDEAIGRLQGVTARLYPGDQVGLMLLPEHPVYTSVFSPAVGQVTVSGTVGLPLLTDANAPPQSVPAYVIEN
ncbi:MAG: CocE/NonD family hydrolase [Oceanococcus sp.]